MSQTRILNLKDIVIMTVVANLGIRWIPVAAGIGPSSILFWLLGAAFFFLPLALIVAELSCAYPEAGGIYAWTRRALGLRSGFIIAWMYWVNNLFFYPAILTFLVSNLAYAFSRPDLANNPEYVIITTLACFWTMTLVSLYGLKANKYASIMGAIFGMAVPIGALIVLGFVGLIVFQHSATTFSLSTLLPNQGLISNLSSLSMLMFAMAGIEIVTVFAGSTVNPHKTLPKGLLSSAVVIFVLYVLGTLAMNFIATPDEIAKTTGVVQAFSIIDAKFHIAWFTKVLAFLLVISEMAALAVWIVAPVVLFFSCIPDGILPKKLHQLNTREVPQNALLFQGVLVTGIILVTSLLPSVNDMYQVLVLMSTVLYFIPYIFLALSYIKLRNQGHSGLFKVPGKKLGTGIIAGFTLVSVILGIGLSFMPTGDLTTTHALISYEAELILGPLIFIAIGMMIFQLRKHKLKEQQTLS